MRGDIKAQTAGALTSSQGVPAEAAEEEATARTRQRQEQGHVGQSDNDESLPADTKRENIRQTVHALGLPDSFADTLAARIVADHVKYQFVSADLGSAVFFQIK